jgi:hypothetical protein
MGSPVNGNIPGGTGWIDFLSGGKLVASVNSPVSMGSTDVQAYINTGGVRINSMQYYHDRNITIKPATINLSDSATVRFYFLDSETEALINVTGCGICSKPAMAYELGVTKYSDPDDSKENGTLADNTPGNYIFINSSKTRIIPFDKGYYAEFKVKDFCELWLNDGGMDNNTPLPLKLLSFTARKKDKDALLEWRTTEEVNFSHFEIEVARGNTDYQLNRFSRIGTIASTGNGGSDQYYHFTDAEFNKSGVRYYRLKMIDIDGKFSYSPIRPLLFSAEQNWQLFPNPSQGQFYLLYQLPDGETLSLKLYDANGRLVREVNSLSSGFQQKLLIDLADPKLPPGLYMLEARGKDKEQFFRLIKQ